MSNRSKNAIYSLVLIFIFGSIYFYRKYQEENKATEQLEADNFYKSIQGEAQGTTYLIRYQDSLNRDFKPAIDSLLADFDASLSTWKTDSDISVFNNADTNKVSFRYPYFYEVLKRSQDFYQLSNGLFDPTVAPLVNAWGFGFKKADQVNQKMIDSLLLLVDFRLISFDDKGIKKTKNGVMLDFNAIAQGYSVDVLAVFLEKQGIQNFMIELGGEFVCKGVNQEGNAWGIGIKNPILAEQGKTEAKAIIQLKDKGLATSGNYEKFYVKDGKKYAHTLNPKTGYPVEHSLLSATVVAKDAAAADAFATLMMVLGVDESKKLLQKFPELAVYLIYADEKGEMKSFINSNMQSIISEIE